MLNYPEKFGVEIFYSFPVEKDWKRLIEEARETGQEADEEVIRSSSPPSATSVAEDSNVVATEFVLVDVEECHDVEVEFLAEGTPFKSIPR